MLKETWEPWKDEDAIPKIRHQKKKDPKSKPYWLRMSNALPDLDSAVATPYAGGNLREGAHHDIDPMHSLYTDFSAPSTSKEEEDDGPKRFTIEELDKLYKRAVRFSGTVLHPFHILYRCKPRCYWDDIHTRTSGIMEVYLKDDTGHEESPINGRLHGLFFSPNLDQDGSLPATSPFGEVRFLVKPLTLLNPRKHNLYLTDFYCIRLAHYLTLVVCEKNSTKDKFCLDNLLQLDWKNNHFLHVVEGDRDYKFYVNKNTIVEIFFTFNIPLSAGVFDTVKAAGTGSSKIEGLGRNRNCTTCNLYPLKKQEVEKRKTLDEGQEILADMKEEDYISGEDGEQEDEESSADDDLWDVSFASSVGDDKNEVWEKIGMPEKVSPKDDLQENVSKASNPSTSASGDLSIAQHGQLEIETTSSNDEAIKTNKPKNGINSSTLSFLSPISQLYEFCAKRYWKQPQFSVEEKNDGPRKTFLWAVVIRGEEYVQSSPTSNKKGGKTMLCKEVLEKLVLVHAPDWYLTG